MSRPQVELIIASPIGLGQTTLGKFTLHKIEEREPATSRVCPKCLQPPVKPAAQSYGTCPTCQQVFSRWQECLEAVKDADGHFLPRAALNTEATKQAKVYCIDLSEIKGFFAKGTFGLIPHDDTAKANLVKLAVMLKSFNKAVVLKVCFRKGSEEHIILVMPNTDGYIVGSELIPFNLLDSIPEGLVQIPEISAVNKTEVETLIKLLPPVRKDDLTVETGFPTLADAAQSGAVKKLEEMISSVIAESPPPKPAEQTATEPKPQEKKPAKVAPLVS